MARRSGCGHGTGLNLGLMVTHHVPTGIAFGVADVPPAFQRSEAARSNS
ncbi:MAG TPA: hypothetical protein VER96_29395 [Polyangiaceae bacterium]|nr:hypothetical protein [Polyangiaceae bacterium]